MKATLTPTIEATGSDPYLGPKYRGTCPTCDWSGPWYKGPDATHHAHTDATGHATSHTKDRSITMKKIPTLLLRDPQDRPHVLDEITPGCEWVLAGEGVPTRKYDGTCVCLSDGAWYARREVKPGKQPPLNYRPVELDSVTGKTVGWEPIEQSPFYKFWLEASSDGPEFLDGTYELVGPKINGNPEGELTHRLIFHDSADEVVVEDLTVEGVKNAVSVVHGIGAEGIVWHHPDGRMAKLKWRDLR